MYWLEEIYCVKLGPLISEVKRVEIIEKLKHANIGRTLWYLWRKWKANIARRKIKTRKKIFQYLDYSESIAKAFVFHQTSRNLFTIQKLRYFSIIFWHIDIEFILSIICIWLMHIVKYISSIQNFHTILIFFWYLISKFELNCNTFVIKVDFR